MNLNYKQTTKMKERFKRIIRPPEAPDRSKHFHYCEYIFCEVDVFVSISRVIRKKEEIT